MIIIGALDCLDPKTGDNHSIVAVSGSPGEAEGFYAAIREHMNPKTIFAPSIELGDCKCVVPRLYEAARRHDFVVRGMTLGEYETGKKIEPCRYCRKHKNEILKGVRLA